MTSIGNFIHWLFGLRGNESTNLGYRWSGASYRKLQNGQIGQKAKYVKISPRGQKDASPHGLPIHNVFLPHIGNFGGFT